jgi:hypothetical protein
VFVSPSLIAQTDAAVEETLHNSSWLDVATVLPPSLAPADVAQLLDKCGGVTRDAEHKRGQVSLLGGGNALQMVVTLPVVCVACRISTARALAACAAAGANITISRCHKETALRSGPNVAFG